MAGLRFCARRTVHQRGCSVIATDAIAARERGWALWKAHHARTGILAVLAVPSIAAARTGKSHSRDHGHAAAIVGTWSADVTPDQGPPLKAVLTFTRGGGVIETESDAPGTGQGAWKRIGHNRFAFAFQTFIFTPTGDPAGNVVVRSVVTLTNDTLAGPFKFDVLDPAGTPVPGESGSGTATAKRFIIPPL